MPQVKQKSSLVVRVGLFDKATGKAIHEEQTNGYVYPVVKMAKQPRVYLIGESKDATSIMQQMGVKEVVRSGELLPTDLIIVADSSYDAAVQAKVEAAVKESLDKLMENKTVIAIAHRLSTIAAMDRLIVLKEGQIAEIGTHEELLKLDGVYASLWNKQTNGFIGK